jgi:hypothetical protein
MVNLQISTLQAAPFGDDTVHPHNLADFTSLTPRGVLPIHRSVPLPLHQVLVITVVYQCLPAFGQRNGFHYFNLRGFRKIFLRRSTRTKRFGFQRLTLSV